MDDTPETPVPLAVVASIPATDMPLSEIAILVVALPAAIGPQRSAQFERCEVRAVTVRLHEVRRFKTALRNGRAGRNDAAQSNGRLKSRSRLEQIIDVRF